MIRLTGPQAIGALPGFDEGLFTVQDLSASQAITILNPQQGWAILDMCAAPGVKTTQLAEVTGDSARIIATDIDSERLKRVQENVTRLGIKSVTTVVYEQLFGNSQFSILNSKLDAVLLDVPCSNTGVLARRVEARFRITPAKIEELAKVQTELLNKTATLIKTGGKICYSTCSIQRAENEERVRDFLAHNPAFQLESEKLILPSAELFDHDGGYVAVMWKTPASA
jgi:16S rRNA (cytosine967-C5)-methyltransferase